MSAKQCQEILSNIEKTIGEITFEDDIRLKQLLEMTVDCDQRRLEELKELRNKALEEKQNEEESLAALKARLQRAKDEKEKVEKKLNAYCESQSQGKLPGSSGGCKKYKEFQNSLTEALVLIDSVVSLCLNRELLDVYMEITGVHPLYKTPQDSVRGFVGVKGTTPSESRLLPFDLMANDPAVSDKIWERIAQASCSSDRLIEDNAVELSKMQIG